MPQSENLYRVFSVEYYNERLGVEMLDSIEAESSNDAEEKFSQQKEDSEEIKSIEEAFCIDLNLVDKYFDNPTNFDV